MTSCTLLAGNSVGALHWGHDLCESGDRHPNERGGTAGFVLVRRVQPDGVCRRRCDHVHLSQRLQLLYCLLPVLMSRLKQRDIVPF